MREELSVDLLGALRRGGERLTSDRRCDVRRRRRPGRTLAQAGEMVEAVVDHAVGEGAEGAPVLRIEGEVGVGGHGGSCVGGHHAIIIRADGTERIMRALRYLVPMKDSTREMLVFLGAALVVILIAAGPKLWWLARTQGWLG